MKLKFAAVTIIAGFTAVSVFAGGSSPAPTQDESPDKTKVSYAVGTRLGLQLRDVKDHVDTTVAIQAIQDVLDGKPTMIEESDIPNVLNKGRAARMGGPSDADDKKQFSYAGGMRAALMYKRTGFDLDSKIVCDAIQDEMQGKSKMDEAETMKLFKSAAAYEATKKGISNKADGESFLAKNAKQSGINILPDGLQYQILQEGTGPLATKDDLIFIKYRGTFINGSEFEHHNHFLTRINGGIQGWKDVLPKMKVGAEWKIFVPANLAYGDSGLPSKGVSPSSAVIYDLQLLSIAPPGGNYQVSSGMGNGSDVDASSPTPSPAK